MSMSKHIAEMVAIKMGNNGQVFTAPNGDDLDKVCRDAGARGERGTGQHWDSYRYEFWDGSAIVVCGEAAWDIEGREPWSWEGAE